MKRLCNELRVNKKIEEIHATNIKDAIREAYKSDKYSFYLNSELIDVNNRFRIFNFDGINYICKKSNFKDAEYELSLVSKAKLLVDNIAVDNYTLKVVMPKVFEINDDYYILTEFQGTTLQEWSYDRDSIILFTEETLFNILNKFMQLGVLYRGFLPRNTILNGNTIYLLDWEDAIFFSNSDKHGINLLWLTNFLLNWGYIYDVSNLKNRIVSSNIKYGEEPGLLKYEIKFAEWAGLDLDKKTLREKIMDTVLFAEKKLKDDYGHEFTIMPNGMAHLVSDLFNSDIDAFFDISSFIIRKKSENKYYEMLKFLSSLIIKQYYQNKNIHKCALIVILIIFEIAAENDVSIWKITGCFTNADEFMNDKNVLSFKLVNAYLFNSNEVFEKVLSTTIINIIKNYNGNDAKNNNIKHLANYILSFKEEE